MFATNVKVAPWISNSIVKPISFVAVSAAVIALTNFKYGSVIGVITPKASRAFEKFVGIGRLTLNPPDVKVASNPIPK